jgi:hypothetical protein
MPSWFLDQLSLQGIAHVLVYACQLGLEACGEQP